MHARFSYGTAAKTRGSALFIGLNLACLSCAFAASSFWEAKKLAEMPTQNVNLLDADKHIVPTVTVAHMRSLVAIKERLEAAAHVDTTLLIQSDQSVNAFATFTEGRNILAVTLGLLRLTDDDPEEMAAVLGHEMGHLVRNHAQESATRDSIVNLLGAIIGIALEARTQQKYHVQGLGLNLSELGTRAVTTSFSRDQEREADALGVGWMVDAGYDPDGAIRLWTKMLRSQGDSPLVFLNTHPNPSERLDNVRWLAQENSGRVTQVANSAKQPTPTPPVQSTPQPAASLVAATSENTANSAFRRGLAAA